MRRKHAEVPGREAEEGIPPQPQSGVRDDEQDRSDARIEDHGKGPGDGAQPRNEAGQEDQVAWRGVVHGIEYRVVLPVYHPLGYAHIKLERRISHPHEEEQWSVEWRG